MFSYNKRSNFVVRRGRLTSAQKQAITDFSAKYVIPCTERPLQGFDIFGRGAPLVVDIGTGTGDSTIGYAKAHPENDYIAIEPYKAGHGQILRSIAAEKLKNIRVIADDAVTVFRDLLATCSVDEIFISFPDPWPKKRHRKRRLLNPFFIELVQKVLKTQGRLFIATDCPDYAEQIDEICKPRLHLLNSARALYSLRPNWHPLTKYEYRAVQANRKIRYFYYVKADNESF